MKESIENKYVKRTQKDYSMSFKLQVVQELERGELGIKAATRKYGIQGSHTVTTWLRKYGTFDWENQTPSNMPKTQEQKLLELEQKIKLLEKQKAFLEKQVETADRKAIIFDMMIDLAEKEFNIPIRKKCLPEQLIIAEKKKKKQ
jgi:transposase-like protein